MIQVLRYIIQNRIKLLLLSVFFGYNLEVSAQLIEIGENINSDWTLYSEVNGVKVYFRHQACQFENVNNQVLLLFKFENVSESNRKIHWKTKFYRNGDCYNCHRLDNPEYGYELSLNSGEILEGDGLSKQDKRVYLFSHFIDKVSGMSDSMLSHFELIFDQGEE